MQKRLFVGIALPEDVKKRLFRFVEKEFKGLPVKWGSKENYHITLDFLGYVEEEQIPEICDRIGEAAEKGKIFEAEFSLIEIGPTKKSKRLIWASGKIYPDLVEIKNKIDGRIGVPGSHRKSFVPHITLGRIKRGQWQKLKEEPDIEREFHFFVPVSSIELFESKFEKGKRVYYVLQSFPLK